MRILLILLLTVLALMEPANPQTGQLRAGQTGYVKFARIRLAEGERISGFSLTIKQGHVQAVSQIPIDWSIAVDVASWQTVVSGTCGHGASGLNNSAELPTVTFRVLDVPDQGPTFAVEADLQTTTDFEKASTRRLGAADLLVRVANPGMSKQRK